MAEQQIVVVDPNALARQQLAEEMKRLEKNPLDETVPGGRYTQADGSVKDAHGNVLEEAPKPKIDKSAGTEDAGVSSTKARRGKKK